jgi:hypothetical protein
MSEINYKNPEESDSVIIDISDNQEVVTNESKACIIFLLSIFITQIILFFSFLYLDYIALEDISCVYQPVKFVFPLWVWLWADIAIIYFLIATNILVPTFSMFCPQFQASLKICNFSVMNMIAAIASFVFTIMGSILFWRDINKSLCRKITWEYIYVILVLKLISFGLRIIDEYLKKK